MTNPSIILPQSPAFAENNVYAARVEDGAVPLYNVLPLTFTRASNGTRVNKDGLIENMTSNVPRITYPIGGGCGSLLLEPQRTNLVTYSEDFSNVIWISTNTSKTSNTATSPDGTQNADLISADGVNNSHVVYQNASVTSGTSYALSCFIKKGTNDYAQVVGGTTAFGSNVWANFDLNTGVVGSVGSSATASIQDMGNGWYRCVVIGAATSTGSYPAIIVAIVPSSTSTRTEASTLTTNILVWGAQLEASSTYATTYIPTTSAAATRIADDVPQKDITSFGIGNSYTLFWDLSLNSSVFNAVFWELYNSSSTTTFTIRNFNGVLRAYNNIDLSYPLGVTPSSNNKYIIRIDETSYSIFYSNSGTPTKSTATMTTARDLGYFSFRGDLTDWTLNQHLIFPTALTDTQCLELVS